MAESYNGWTNYETWRIKLEIFDGDFWEDVSAEFCQDLVEEYIEQESKGLAFGYAMSFLEDVNWHEIADSLKREDEDEAA